MAVLMLAVAADLDAHHLRPFDDLCCVVRVRNGRARSHNMQRRTRAKATRGMQRPGAPPHGQSAL
jgi:hypothetical protein